MSTTVLIVSFEATLTMPGGTPEALRRIVVPLDGSAFSRCALVPAEELARRTGARLELLSTKVAEGPSQPSSFLDELADEISDRGSPIEVQTSIRMEGDPARAIEAAVAQDALPTLIVMSSHGRGRIRRAVLGSTAELVVASGAAPALVVGPSFAPDRFEPDGPVVVAHDGDHEPDAETIVRLARTATGRVTVLEIVHPNTTLPGRERRGLVVSDSAARFAGKLRGSGLDVTTRAMRALHPHKAIVDAAQDLAASYVVITSRSRTGARRAALGSVAAGVVRTSPIPALVNRSS